MVCNDYSRKKKGRKNKNEKKCYDGSLKEKSLASKVQKVWKQVGAAKSNLCFRRFAEYIFS